MSSPSSAASACCRCGPGPPPGGSRRVSGMRPSRARASSAPPSSGWPASSSARATMASWWSGCSSSDLRAARPRRPRRAARRASPRPRWAAGCRRTRRTLASGCAPTNPLTTLPLSTAYTAGMPCTWNAWDTCGFSSTFTLTSTTLPSVSPTTFSRIGPSVRQGPHHGAHRSTTTGVVADRSRTSAWNEESVTSMLTGTGYRWTRMRQRPAARAPRRWRPPIVDGAPGRRTGAIRGTHRARGASTVNRR